MDTTSPQPQRTTKQRTAILDALAHQDDFRSAQQIHEQMRADGEKVGLATVYRNLQTMSRSGQVDVLVTDDGESIYRQCAKSDHHHHLVCRVCGRTVEIQAPQVEELTREIARNHGFSDVHHTMEIFGLCPEHADAAEDEGSH
jgi:Fur family ferric uptake transcriptional regulator